MSSIDSAGNRANPPHYGAVTGDKRANTCAPVIPAQAIVAAGGDAAHPTGLRVTLLQTNLKSGYVSKE